MAEREWRSVPGFEDAYMVSDDGLVRSLERTCTTYKGERRVRERLLSPLKKYKNGQLQSTCVKLSREGGNVHITIARLVLLAFIGERPGMIAHYRDGNPENLTLQNLQWSTESCVAKQKPNGGYTPPKKRKYHERTGTSSIHR